MLYIGHVVEENNTEDGLQKNQQQQEFYFDNNRISFLIQLLIMDSIILNKIIFTNMRLGTVC